MTSPALPKRLKKRKDFLRAASGRKAHGALFTLQAIAHEAELTEPRVGFTVTKKVGGSVERNRIKRRLREVVRVTPNLFTKATHDYVLIARRDVLSAAFPILATSLKAAIRKLDADPSSKSRRDRPAAPSRAIAS